MPLLRELGTAVRRRRQELGLSQQQLAELADLSRATINNLETGKLADLSSNRVERLANELGFAIGLVGTRRSKDADALAVAARVASVPYAAKLPPSVLLESLREGIVPPDYIPHVRTFLDEAPIALLADVVEELHKSHHVPKHDTWKRMRTLASVLRCDRPIWKIERT